MIKKQQPSEPIAKLVYETLEKLSELGLDFKPPKDDPNAVIFDAIKKDICGGDLSYFPNEFDDIVAQVNNTT